MTTFALIAWLVCIHPLYVRRPRNMFSIGSPRNTHPPVSASVLPGAQPHRNGPAHCKVKEVETERVAQLYANHPPRAHAQSSLHRQRFPLFLRPPSRSNTALRKLSRLFLLQTAMNVLGLCFLWLGNRSSLVFFPLTDNTPSAAAAGVCALSTFLCPTHGR